VASDSEAWTDNWDALCVTVTRAAPEEAARLIALADFSEFPTSDAADDWSRESTSYDRAWFATGAVDGWTFVWETNGWQGVTVDSALRLANGGPLVSMYWNVNSVMSFLALDHGVILRQFNPLFHNDMAPPTPVIGKALDSEAGLDWDLAPRLSALTVLSLTTGTRAVSPSWLREAGVRFWGHRF